MSSRRLLLLPAVALLVAACSSAGSTPGAASVEPSSAASAAQTRIEVTLSDSLKVDPSSMTVPKGVPVTFVVTNAGATDHEFYLGDEAAQAMHAEEMMGMTGMSHDEPEGIGLKPGETKELTYTFAEAGSLMAGCHVSGHYDAGMKASITVTE